MEQYGHDARPLVVPHVVLLGAHLALDDGVDRLEVRGVGDERDLDGLA